MGQRLTRIAEAEKCEKQASLLCEMAAIYPGDPTGEIMKSVRELMRRSANLRRQALQGEQHDDR